MNNKSVIAEATRRAGTITNSVLVLARIAKVTPAVLASALVDDDANGDFLASFTAELVKASLKKARDDAEDNS